MPFDGLWDTGASATVITQRVVDYLALSPISKTKVHDSSGERISDVYSVTLLLPSMRINIPMVIIGILPGFDLLIGMDVITLGDFSITNKNGNTVFSFRMPSQKHIDYVEESRIEDLRSKKGGFRQKR